jgi:hypothetical protein
MQQKQPLQPASTLFWSRTRRAVNHVVWTQDGTYRGPGLLGTGKALNQQKTWGEWSYNYLNKKEKQKE